MELHRPISVVGLHPSDISQPNMTTKVGLTTIIITIITLLLWLRDMGEKLMHLKVAITVKIVAEVGRVMKLMEKISMWPQIALSSVSIVCTDIIRPSIIGAAKIAITTRNNRFTPQNSSLLEGQSGITTTMTSTRRVAEMRSKSTTMTWKMPSIRRDNRTISTVVETTMFHLREERVL